MLPNAPNSIQPPSSLQSALQMDPNQHLQLQQQQQQQEAPQTPATKRRKRAEGNDEDGPASSEPRRLRRSHEACARCRSKKIKQCDSKHPRCTACATAGTACNQEDRHRRTLTPRGYTERLELQVAQCEALLKRHYPGFVLDSLDDLCAREGIDVAQDAVRPFRAEPAAPPKGPPYGPMYGPLMHPPYGPHPMMPYGAAPPYHMLPPGPPGPYPHLHPVFPAGPYPPPVMHQHQPPPPEQLHAPPPVSPSLVRAAAASKGVDPNGHDMSNPQALAKNFGVSELITSGIKLDSGNEELPIDPSTLPKLQIHGPRDPKQWISVAVRRGTQPGSNNTLSFYGPISKSAQVDVWLPKDRNFARHIVDVYFTRLNIHRPVYARKELEKILADLYDGHTPIYDPGHVCSIYLVFALGTLSELNHRAASKLSEKDGHLGSAVAKKLMPAEWPSHDEFFERSLVVKPDLLVSITSLQALILLHWYLYIERQGRTLWRLVGTLVRLSIELGLHHDPTIQMSADETTPEFTEEEAQLRIRLWGIVLVHDRGTSILLGRPLAVSPSDSNTPQPNRAKSKHLIEFSEHFEFSHSVVEIQADIVNALYAPTRQAGDTIMRNATRIIKRMVEFRDHRLPEKYRNYFTGTQSWSLDKRQKLVTEITEEEGLTLLKIGIARILMLRALFSSKGLSYAQKHKALIDAIITAHNVIIVHSQLIRFPDIAFFTSPIPLHIAAMVILYGHISQVDCLPPPVALEDVGLALDMIPRFRWRWERKDANGGHPLIAKLVETIMRVNLHTIVPSSSSSVLYCELDWEEVTSPTLGAQPPLASPHGAYATGSSSGAGDGTVYGPHPRAHAHNGAMARAPTAGSASNTTSGGTPPERLADMPQGLLYPFYPEADAHLSSFPGAGAPADPSGATVHTYDPLLRQAAALQGAYGTGAEAAHGDARGAAAAGPAPTPMWTHVRPPASQPAKPH
ncbi:hypothetical protein HYPSUDRAFT_614687 [Hypholoma sublateritium FD-334 SS-4]|uniref:Zn(2)-C6 fungal-type domain-containing protein n=1 Tax=Hypholoma sublateritium (strain FD-334 SS-4) TaxID=945553 RepID=A0A0D2L7B4_HYPSF|nr:hypothetical protein HYPSUDRAFT_614687 [Hypholoma sublateritium FD-334 SS-4]